ncbi:MAG: class I SAM-dependent methyltransferase [Planctomycetes bacterium]|nr:class I SAM-dependent methyltransferase [Planctomycetota bacterium]
MIGLVKKIFKRRKRIRREREKLDQIPTGKCTPANLRSMDENSIKAMFSDQQLNEEWENTQPVLDETCPIADGTTGGVNPGDRRGLWYIARHVGAASILEIGTHVGASTCHLAMALKQNRCDGEKILVTLDIEDVNDEFDGYWKRYGLPMKPKDIIAGIGCETLVEFVKENSLAFLENCERKFDLIFLDGNHDAYHVYQEIPKALDRLNQNGTLVMHDYFDADRIIWPDGNVEPGTFIALKRLRREGVKIEAKPVNEFPWETKKGSRETTLAFLSKIEG